MAAFEKGSWSMFLCWTFQATLYNLVWACRLPSSISIKGVHQGSNSVTEMTIDKQWFFFFLSFFKHFSVDYDVYFESSCLKMDLWPCLNLLAEATKLKCPETLWWYIAQHITTINFIQSFLLILLKHYGVHDQKNKSYSM